MSQKDRKLYKPNCLFDFKFVRQMMSFVVYMTYGSYTLSTQNVITLAI